MVKYKKVGETDRGVPIYEKVEKNERVPAIIPLITSIVVLITAILGLIGTIPAGSSDEPLACSFNTTIFDGIYNCNGTVNIVSQSSTNVTSTATVPAMPPVIVVTATPNFQPTATTAVQIVTATSNPQVTIQVSTPSVAQINPISNRAIALEKYSQIYIASGWCSVWQELIADGLVSGECPTKTLDVPEGDYALAGAQLVTLSSTGINFPACVQYAPSRAFLESGDEINGPEPLKESTDSIFTPGSVFTLYFRCEINSGIAALHASQ